MRQFLLFMLLGLLCSCSSIMPKSPTAVLFRQSPSSLAKFAVDNYPANRKIEVVRDSLIEAQLVEIPFYSSCSQRIVEMNRTAGVGEANQGILYVNERNCEMVPGEWVAGSVYVLTQDVHSSKQVWVASPALLFATDDKSIIEVAKEYITLNPTGNGEYIWIQK